MATLSCQLSSLAQYRPHRTDLKLAAVEVCQGVEVQRLPTGRHSVPELLLDGEAPAPVDPLLLELDVLVLLGHPVPDQFNLI